MAVLVATKTYSCDKVYRTKCAHTHTHIHTHTHNEYKET